MNFLDVTHELLIKSDENYCLLWGSLSEERIAAIAECWRRIEVKSSIGTDLLLEPHHRMSRSTARFFVHVQEREIEYSRIRRDWYNFTINESALVELYGDALLRLELFVDRYLECQAILYGGIKPVRSLLEKLHRKAGLVKDNRVRPEIVDTWDVVRFRLVLPNLMTLRHTAMRFWEVFFDDVMRCRNYYYRPRVSGGQDTYRAIHFELLDLRGRVIEVQLISELREAISLVDHSLLFKRRFTFLSADHELWLKSSSLAANIIDGDSLSEHLGTLEAPP